MADSWSIILGDESVVQLNASFWAPQYEAGGVDTSATRRRDDRAAYQRSGDGLRTPGAVRLNGRVWSDARDVPAMLTEINAIREAVATAVQVVRTTTSGTYVYENLAGGATPTVTPDGQGGFTIELEFWPGKAEAAFIPAPPPGGVEFIAANVGNNNFQQGSAAHSVPLPAGIETGDLVVVMLYGYGTITAAPGWSNVNGAANLNPLTVSPPGNVWAFQRIAVAAETAFDYTATNHMPFYSNAVLRGNNLSTSSVSSIVQYGFDDPQVAAVTGVAGRDGLQLLLGAGEIPQPI